MKTIHDIYRARLRLLVAEYGSQTALAAALDKPAAQISQWLSTSPSSRQLSPATARLIEKVLGKPAGWMDQPLDVFHGDEAASLAELRRRHLYGLFMQAGDFGVLADRTGQHPRHLMAWLDGSALMDEVAARQIERALLLPAGQLDTWAAAPTNNWQALAHENQPTQQPPLPAAVTLTEEEQTLLAAWRSAAQSVRQAVRLVLAPAAVRDLLDMETRMALKVIELAAPLALGGQMQRLAAA